MGSDLYHLHQQIVANSHPELCALLRRIRDEMLLANSAGYWDRTIAAIEQALNNASIK